MHHFHRLLLILVWTSIYLIHTAIGCNWNTDNVQEKYVNSSLVVLTKFLGFTPNQTDPRVMLIARFKPVNVLKNIHDHPYDENIHYPVNGILNLSLYRGHAIFSTKMWCMNDRMFRNEKKYILFLNYSTSPQSRGTGGPVTQGIRNVFLPEVWNRRTKEVIERKINEDASVMGVVEVQSHTKQSNVETPIGPVFEVELDLDNADEITKKAEIDPNKGLHLRCNVKGEAHDTPELGWIYAGSVLTTNQQDGIEVETDNAKLVTNVKLSTKHAVKGGTYECTAKRKADGKFYNSKLKITPRTAPSNETLFGEVFCGADREGWCQHGGTCLYQPTTGIYSCRCRNGYSGGKCEYDAPQVHIITRTSATSPPPAITDGHYKQSMIWMGSTAGILIIALILAFMLYVKKREQIKTRFSRVSFRKRRDASNASESGTKNIDDEEQLIHRLQSTTYPPGREIMNERIRIIQSLLPARCPHCHHKLGIKLNRASEPYIKPQSKEKDVTQSTVKSRSVPDQLEIDVEISEERMEQLRPKAIDSMDQKPIRNTDTSLIDVNEKERQK